MSLRNDRSQEIWEKDRQHFLHPWTHFTSFKEEGSLIMSEADGVHVYDTEGKKYIDGIGGLWCVNIGYGNEELIDAMADQARRMVYFSPFTDVSNVPAAELASKLSELAPGVLNHVFFSCGGSTANEMAFRLIEYYNGIRGKPNKRHWIARREAYHGGTHITQSMGGKTMDYMPEFSYRADIFHHLTSPNPYRRPAELSTEAFCDQLIEEFSDKVAELGADNVAAFIAEPIMGAGGVVVPPDGYLQRIHMLCKQNDILYISDEVVTAFGRLGHWFASKDVFGIEPDIITCAKGLTSGYVPLGATIYSDAIHDVIFSSDDSRLFTSGFTYSGHPVACAVALKNLELMERDNLFDHVKEVGAYFFEQLKTLRDLPTVGEVRGSHFMVCIENVADKETKELFPDEVNIGKRIANAAEERGVIVRPVAHLNVLSPPLTINREQCDEIVGVLRESILSVVDELRTEGMMAA